MVTVEEKRRRRKDFLEEYLDEHFDITGDLNKALSEGIITEKEYKSYSARNNEIQRQIKEGLLPEPNHEFELSERSLNDKCVDLSQEETARLFSHTQHGVRVRSMVNTPEQEN